MINQKQIGKLLECCAKVLILYLFLSIIVAMLSLAFNFDVLIYMYASSYISLFGSLLCSIILVWFFIAGDKKGEIK